MKLAFGKFNLPIDLSLASAKNPLLGADLRTGLLKSLYDLGHEITIYTKLSREEEKARKGSLMTLVKNGRNDWRRKIGYKIESLIDKDTDVFLMECGATNTIYQYKSSKGKEVSFIVRACMLAQSFKGLIVYWQHSPVLQFPFGDALNPPTEKVSPLNIRRIISSTGLFEDKKWRILLNIKNIDYFITIANCRGRKCYKDFEDILEFVHIPITYSDHDPYLKLKEKPEWDLCYVGGENDSGQKGVGGRNSRFEGIQRLYDHPKLKSRLIGRWDPETVEKFEHLKYEGSIGTSFSAYEFLNDSYACVWTNSEYANKIGFTASRIPQVIRAGAVLLVDEEVTVKEDYVDDEFYVSNAKDVVRWIGWIKELSLDEREELRQIQLRKIPKFSDLDWNSLLT